MGNNQGLPLNNRRAIFKKTSVSFAVTGGFFLFFFSRECISLLTYSYTYNYLFL